MNRRIINSVFCFSLLFVFCLSAIQNPSAQMIMQQGIAPYTPKPLEKRLQEESIFLRMNAFILYIDGKTMEDSIAQLVRFYERKGWARTKPIYYSGQAVIYEDAPLPKDKVIFPAEFNTHHLWDTAEFICRKTQGLFRERYLGNRVLVIQKAPESLLDLQLPQLTDKQISPLNAMQFVVDIINKQNKKVKIRVEKPSVIRMRAGMDSSLAAAAKKQLAMFQDLPPSILETPVKIELSFKRSLSEALTAIIASQPYPLYLTIRPEPQGAGFTHVLRVDTLPSSEVKLVRYADTAYENYYRDWWYLGSINQGMPMGR